MLANPEVKYAPLPAPLQSFRDFGRRHVQALCDFSHEQPILAENRLNARDLRIISQDLRRFADSASPNLDASDILDRFQSRVGLRSRFLAISRAIRHHILFLQDGFTDGAGPGVLEK